MPEVFLDAIMFALEKKQPARNYTVCRIISLISHIAMIVARIPTRILKHKMEEVLIDD